MVITLTINEQYAAVIREALESFIHECSYETNRAFKMGDEEARQLYQSKINRGLETRRYLDFLLNLYSSAD